MNFLSQSGSDAAALASLAEWVGRASWQASILVLVVLLVRRACGARLVPRWRHALWWLVVVRLMVPVLPESPWSLFNWVPRVPWSDVGIARSAATAAPVVVALGSGRTPDVSVRAGTFSGAGFGSERGQSGMPVSGSTVAPAAEPATDGSGTGGAAAPAGVAASSGMRVSVEGAGTAGRPSAVWNWRRGLAWAWFLGAGVLLVGWVCQHAVFERRVRRWGRPVGPEVRGMIDECCRELALRPGIEALEGPMVPSPAVFGVRRPRLLLPEGLTSGLTPAQLRHVLLHELGHVRRRDPAINAAMAVLQAVHWFNPFVWLAFRRMREDRELATDALALAVAGEAEARAYGRTIVRVLEGWAATPVRPGLVGIWEDPGELPGRMRAIAGFRRPTRWAAWGGALVAGLGVVAWTNARTDGSGAGGAGGAVAGERVWSHEFAGWAALARQSELPQVREVLALPETDRLRRRWIDKLAATGGAWLGSAAAPGEDRTGAWATWIGDFLEAEHALEIRIRGEELAGWAAAVRLPKDRGDAWREAARAVWDPSGAAARTRLGALRSEDAGEWRIVGAGPGGLEALRERIRAAGGQALVAVGQVGRFAGDGAALARWLGWGGEAPGPIADWPKAEGVLDSGKGRLRLEARLAYPRDLDWEPEAWVVPTNLVRDPLVGFTAMQGVDRWMRRRTGAASLPAEGWGGQGFAWSLADGPWRQYAAATHEAPESVLGWMAEHGVVWVADHCGLGRLDVPAYRSWERRRVDFHGLPFFRPFVAQTEDRGRIWLHAGGMTMPGRPEPMPAALLAQLEGQRDLLFYDWETTGRRWLTTNRVEGQASTVVTNEAGRLRQLVELTQYGALLRNRNGQQVRIRPDGSLWVPGIEWVDAAVPWLGDAVTEVRRTGVRELTLRRSSGVGLSSVELLTLLRWLEGHGGQVLASSTGPASAPAPTPRPPSFRSASPGGDAPPPGILRLRARAVDAETGKPIERFQLLWTTTESDDPTDDEWSWDAVSEGRATDGEVEVPVHWAPPAMRFAATASGYRVATTDLLRRPGQHDHVFRLRRGSGPVGRVVAEDGRPLPRISLGLLGYGLTILSGGRLGSSSYDGRGMTRTDDAGRFEFPSLVEGARLAAADPEHGFAEVDAEALAADPTIRMRPWGRIEGTARRAGRVVDGVKVSLGPVPSRGTPRVVVPLDDEYCVALDAAGRFSFPRVPPGTWVLNRMVPLGAETYRFEPLAKVRVASGATERVSLELPGDAARAEAEAPAAR